MKENFFWCCVVLIILMMSGSPGLCEEEFNNYCGSKGNTCNGEGNNDYAINKVQIGDFLSISEFDDDCYSDHTNRVVTLEKGQTYPVTITPLHLYELKTGYFRIWIDFNNDYDFDDVGELVFASSGHYAVSGDMTIPTNATESSTRMRISLKYDSAQGPCDQFQYGEVEDYTANIICNSPIADFGFDINDFTVYFTDYSTNVESIISWNWNFGDGSTSTDQNPTHTYSAAGNYTVTLTVFNCHCESSSISREIIVPRTPNFGDRILNLLDNGNYKSNGFEAQLADVNGDGLADFVATKVADSPTNEALMAVVFLSNGDGTFGDRILNLLDNGNYKSNGFKAHLTDVNGDGRADFVATKVADLPTNEALMAVVFLSNGDGTFGNRILNLLDNGNYKSNGFEAQLTDVNGDGQTDFVATRVADLPTSEALMAVVFLSNGDGTFGDRILNLLDNGNYKSNGFEAQLTDVNGDGRADFVATRVADSPTNEALMAVVFLSNGDGTFGDRILNLLDNGDYKSNGFKAQLTDLDGDGRTDFVATRVADLPTSEALMAVVFLSNGDGTFGDRILNLLDNGNYKSNGFEAQLTDINGNGRADFVATRVADSPTNEALMAVVFLYNGDGTFGDRQLNLLDNGDYKSNGFEAQFADVNGDGRADFVATRVADLPTCEALMAVVFLSICNN